MPFEGWDVSVVDWPMSISELEAVGVPATSAGLSVSVLDAELKTKPTDFALSTAMTLNTTEPPEELVVVSCNELNVIVFPTEPANR